MVRDEIGCIFETGVSVGIRRKLRRESCIVDANVISQNHRTIRRFLLSRETHY